MLRVCWRKCCMCVRCASTLCSRYFFLLTQYFPIFYIITNAQESGLLWVLSNNLFLPHDCMEKLFNRYFSHLIASICSYIIRRSSHMSVNVKNNIPLGFQVHEGSRGSAGPYLYHMKSLLFCVI